MPEVTLKLEEFDKYLNQINAILKFEPTAEELNYFNGSYDEALNAIKQAFFLNIINFLILYQLAVLMVSNPEAIEKLTNYNMWQSFLDNTTITLNGSKMEAYFLIHSILRCNMHPPSDMTHFPLRSKMPQHGKGKAS